MSNYRIELRGRSRMRNPKFKGDMSPAFAELENSIYSLGFDSPKYIRDEDREVPLKDAYPLTKYRNLKFKYFTKGASEMFVNIYREYVRKNLSTGQKVAVCGAYRVVAFLRGFDEEKGRQVARVFGKALEQHVELLQD